MEDNRGLIPTHPQGELQNGDGDRDPVDRGKAVETFGGKVFVRWDAEAAVPVLMGSSLSPRNTPRSPSRMNRYATAVHAAVTGITGRLPRAASVLQTTLDGGLTPQQPA